MEYIQGVNKLRGRQGIEAIISYALVSYCNFAMREPILKILGALERARPLLSNAPKIFKIVRANLKL